MLNSDILYQQTQTETMSQNLIQHPSTSRSPISRTKSPIYLSPSSKKKQVLLVPSKYPSSNMNIIPSELSAVNENMIKNISAQPLQFSAGRKLKPKCPQSVNNVASFLTGVAVGFGGQGVSLGGENLAPRLNNQNKQLWEGQGKGEYLDIAKLRNQYEGQIKSIVENQKAYQQDLENRYRNLEKQRNYWKDSFMIIKSEYDSIRKQKQQKNPTPQTAALPSSNSQQKLKKLQQQVEKCQKALKTTQSTINTLNKEKQQMGYELTFFREQSRKANAKLFQLQYEVELAHRQNAQLKEKISRKEQSENTLTKSMDVPSTGSNNALSFSMEHLGNEESPRRSHSSSRSKNSSSLSLSSSSSGRHRSRHHRSNSNSHMALHQQRTPPPQLMHMQPNIDFCKQIQRFRHSCRKLEKTIINQNTSIMMQGLKKLNMKYAKLYNEEEIEKNDQVRRNRDNTAFFRFPGATENVNIRLGSHKLI